MRRDNPNDVTATIMRRDGIPVADGGDLHSDAQLDALWARAKSLGPNHCVAWHRPSDGQDAWWGDDGASLTPVWTE